MWTALRDLTNHCNCCGLDLEKLYPWVVSQTECRQVFTANAETDPCDVEVSYN